MAFGVGCAGRSEPPVLRSLEAASERVPVILVPGITGSKLRSRASGELIWGDGRQLVSPKDGGYTLVRPLADPVDGPSSDAEAFGLLDRIRLFGLASKQVYAPVVETLEANGWCRGNPSAPTPDADLYLFAYDWRADNIHAAGQLRALLESIAETRRGAERGPTEFDLVCQSNGAHICRYLAKYGAVTLEQAEAGQVPPPGGVHIRKLILVGTSNGGGMRILREVDRGRRYVPLVGRYMQPEVLFSFPAIFQDLPFYEPKPFVDEEGRRLEHDLYDPELWQRHGWSVFAPEARERMAKRPDLFGNEALRVDYLEQVLDRARRLHTLLATDGPWESKEADPDLPRYYLLQNGYYPTPHLAVLREDGSLLFTGDDELKGRPYLSALVSSPGDGHATLESQLALSPAERRALAADPFLVSGGHFELFLDPGALRRMLDFLAE